jgi:hypothetical protein
MAFACMAPPWNLRLGLSQECLPIQRGGSVAGLPALHSRVHQDESNNG